MKKGIAIVGAGHAGVQAAASLRELGYSDQLTLISNEIELPYHRPPLSKLYMSQVGSKIQLLRPERYYTENGINLQLGSLVSRVAENRLETSTGATLDYDLLILALGSRARPLAVPAAGLKGLTYLRNVSDADLIRGAIQTVNDLVIIGGGFIGLELAATLRKNGRNVTIIEAQKRVLGRSVTEDLSDCVSAECRAQGIKILTNTKVEGLVSEEVRITGVRISSGVSLPAQLVVVGVGALPNSELAQASGIHCSNGIKIDNLLRTSAHNVLAIGDCASFSHWMTDSEVRLESVQNAVDQGRLAAKNALGQASTFTAVPWFWSDIGGLKIQIAGLVGCADFRMLLGSTADRKFSVLHFSGRILTAVESVNRPADHMLARKLLALKYAFHKDPMHSKPEELIAAFYEHGARNANCNP